MDTLPVEILNRLAADTAFQATQAVLSTLSAPDSPKTLNKPLVTFQVNGDPDLEGRHGAGQLFECEFSVWGWQEYDRTDYEACTGVARVINQVMPVRFNFTVGSAISVTNRPFKVAGWETVRDARRPELVHLFSRWQMLFYSTQVLGAIEGT